MPILPASTLAEIISALPAVDPNNFETQQPTIYAAEPWSPSTQAVVEWSPFKGGLPDVAYKLGLVRFLEVDIAQNFLKQRLETATPINSSEAMANALIEYVRELIAKRDPYAIHSRAKKASQ